MSMGETGILHAYQTCNGRRRIQDLDLALILLLKHNMFAAASAVFNQSSVGWRGVAVLVVVMYIRDEADDIGEAERV